MNIQEIENLLGAEGQALLKHECKTISNFSPACRARISWIESAQILIVRRQCCATCSTLSTRVVWPALVMFRFCLLTRASNIPPEPVSPKTRFTSTLPRSLNWPSKADATPLLPPCACSARAAANTRTKFSSSSKSIRRISAYRNKFDRVICFGGSGF